MKNELHIVCLDVPWPADYGGAIDMLSRIKMFHELGVAVHLHYFSYNDRGKPNELNQFCKSINVYERGSLKESLPFNTPYIVASRVNDELISNLNKDQLPVLLEGIHCTGILKHLDLNTRKVIVRVHNDESVYYKELGRAEHSLFKKLFFYNESRLLKKYSRHLPGECTYACASKIDQGSLKKEYHLDNVKFLPIYPNWQNVNGQEGQGNFCLYHGNLSVAENEEAAIWLLCKVFTKARAPFIIAGKKPSKRLLKMAELCQHTCIIADPSESELNDLVSKAHINVLPCLNKRSTGIRLKLLHALFEGRHCVTNEKMVCGTGLVDACHVGSNANAFASIIMQLYHQPFTREEIVLRKQLLGNTYDNKKNTRELIQWLS